MRVFTASIDPEHLRDFVAGEAIDLAEDEDLAYIPRQFFPQRVSLARGRLHVVTGDEAGVPVGRLKKSVSPLKNRRKCRRLRRWFIAIANTPVKKREFPLKLPRARWIFTKISCARSSASWGSPT
jgi:hypothetical protein